MGKRLEECSCGRETRGNQSGFYLELMSPVRVGFVHCLQLQLLPVYNDVLTPVSVCFPSSPSPSLLIVVYLSRPSAGPDLRFAEREAEREQQQEQRLPSDSVFSETQLPDESAGELSPSFDSV